MYLDMLFHFIFLGRVRNNKPCLIVAKLSNRIWNKRVNRCCIFTNLCNSFKRSKLVDDTMHSNGSMCECCEFRIQVLKTRTAAATNMIRSINVYKRRVDGEQVFERINKMLKKRAGFSVRACSPLT